MNNKYDFASRPDGSVGYEIGSAFLKYIPNLIAFGQRDIYTEDFVIGVLGDMYGDLQKIKEQYFVAHAFSWIECAATVNPFSFMVASITIDLIQAESILTAST